MSKYYFKLKHRHAHDHRDAPAIFSENYHLVFRQPQSSHMIQQALTKWIEALQDWSKNSSCLIGHIKVFVESKDNLWLSSTGRGINVKYSDQWGNSLIGKATVNVTALIFGTSNTVLREFARQKIKEFLGFNKLKK